MQDSSQPKKKLLCSSSSSVSSCPGVWDRKLTFFHTQSTTAWKPSFVRVLELRPRLVQASSAITRRTMSVVEAIRSQDAAKFLQSLLACKYQGSKYAIHTVIFRYFRNILISSYSTFNKPKIRNRIYAQICAKNSCNCFVFTLH